MIWESLQDFVDMFGPIGAVVIAASSFALSARTARRQQQSLQPIATIHLSDYENLLSVELGNGGAGSFVVNGVHLAPKAQLPAKLLAKIEAREKLEVKHLDLLEPHLTQRSVVACVGDCGVDLWDDFVMDLDGRPVQSTQSITLLKLAMGKRKSEEYTPMRIAVRQKLKDYVLFVVGTNVFGEATSVTYRELAWFGRSLEEGPRAYAVDGGTRM